VQPVVALPVQVAQELSQATHVEPLANLPSGQVLRHAPSSMRGVPVEGQVEQSVLETPEHVSHDAEQSTQLETEATTWLNVSLGHCETHVPAYRNISVEPLQLRHSELEGPVHVPHDASHGWHSWELSAYLAIDTHDERQRPLEAMSENGVAAAQVVQSFSVVPEQVAQLEWQGVQVSELVLLPPEHENPGSV